MAGRDGTIGATGAAVVGIGLAAALVATVAVAALLRGGGDDEGPDDAAAAFASAWAAGDRDAMDALVVAPAALADAHPLDATEALGATSVSVAFEMVDEDLHAARAEYRATVELGDVGEVVWDGELALVEDDERGWLVQWEPAALHPALAGGGALRRTATWPDRAPILGRGDAVLAGPTDDIIVGIEPQRLQDRAAATAALVEQLGIDPATVDTALDAPGVQPHFFVPIVQVRRSEYEAVRSVIHPIPGLVFREATGRGGPTRAFARHVLGRFAEVTAERLEELGPPYEVGDIVGLDGLEARFEEQLAGRPEVVVEAVSDDGEVLAELARFEGRAPAAVRTTLDLDLQVAAEAALADVGAPAALVAVEAATGEVRAIASAPTSEAFNRAIAGAYPPGSTFKVVTAHALLAHGTTPETTVDCPGELVVDGRRFRNFEGGASGLVPFSQAFAESCNTALIGASSSLPGGALEASAAAFGFGVDYSLGPTTLGGSFGTPTTPVERAASAIGQADVTASPLHMATVAAAVVDGTWRSPVMLRDPEAEAENAPVVRPLDASALGPLRSLMRLVVTDGSGTAADVAGLEVIGKTGTAEFGTGDPPPTHAWFVAGARGLGVAVVVEGGEAGGRVAAPVAARFLEAIAR